MNIERESRKEMMLRLFAEPTYVPMKIKELAVILQVRPEDRPELEAVLTELLEENRIELSKRGKYSLAKVQELQGRFVAHENGFGFVEIEDRDEDLFIPEAEVHGAMHGDTVMVKVLPGKSGKRTEASVIKVLERANETLVGYYERAKNGYGFVIPDNKRICVDVFVEDNNILCKPEDGSDIDGMKVVVKLFKYPEGKNPEGKIIELLGFEDEKGVDILSIARAYGLPDDFEKPVLDMAERVAKPVSEADMSGRRDLRELLMVTIDGEDAKDLDDAVSLQIEGDNCILGVHIADVANYVQERSALDKEALKRGTSVYLADRVIPMLPKTLSNGICSLNAGCERLALSCIMKIDKRGNVIDSEIVESVINVRQRLSYGQVQYLFNKYEEGLTSGQADSCIGWEDSGYEPIGSDIQEMLLQMKELASTLRSRRFEKGSIDFDFPESKVILDEKGHTVEIKPYEHNTATRLIEDFMLLANKTVAETFYWQEIPFVYRTHDEPDPEKIRELAHFVNNFGLTMKSYQEQIHPREIQRLLDRIEGTDHESLVARLTLRSMKKAKYTTECTGHFGLAFDYYCHFTSPIRRYPDLQIHRIIKDVIRGRMNESKQEHYVKLLDEVAKQSSDREVLAAEAERETIKLKKAEYMADHLGECFEGVVSGVTAWGIYVELPNTVEGLIPVAALQGDYYNYVEAEHAMIGEHSGKKYTLGQRLMVRAVAADLYNRTVDFELY